MLFASVVFPAKNFRFGCFTSKEGNEAFSQLSGWLPAVIDIEPPEELRVFMPIDDGYPGGFSLFGGAASGNTKRLFETNFHQILGSDKTIDDFLEIIKPKLRGVMIADLNWIIDRVLKRIPVYDTLLGAMWEEMDMGGDLEEKISRMLEVITYQEETTYLKPQSKYKKWGQII